MKKRLLRGIALALALLLLSCVNAIAIEPTAAGEENAAPPVQIAAKAALLMDAATGRVLVRCNENDRLYPASVTKVMTMLLVAEALESGKLALSDQVSASAAAAS
ncbi:MAG: D-alanyl-D-alanine carboxypeptidase, partial [Oscillospiraceae bacterium]|nr:D-alanyl-D-alanine carboxypeptidase [Oscillospiraceae bacterium]